MEQKFSGEVGQVAGRDVKSSNAQASVSIHLHTGAEYEMPRDLLDRVTRYLDGCMPDGAADQAAPASDRPVVQVPIPATSQTPASAGNPAPQVDATRLEKPVPPRWQKRPLSWLAVSIAVAAAAAVASTLYAMVLRPGVSARNQTVGAPSHCEYGSSRYTVGSIVMQAGRRAQCTETGERGVTWQQLDT